RWTTRCCPMPSIPTGCCAWRCATTWRPRTACRTCGSCWPEERTMHRLLIALAGVLATASALADVTVEDAWVRATVPGQKTSGAFMQLTSTTDVTLVGARSPAAGVVEIHEMALD